MGTYLAASSILFGEHGGVSLSEFRTDKTSTTALPLGMKCSGAKCRSVVVVFEEEAVHVSVPNILSAMVSKHSA